MTEERGLDGFTMDDLAECAGVSRWTLFNYVPDKLEAVLGMPPVPDPSNLAEFRAGGPAGRLNEDVNAVVAALLDSKDVAAEDMERIRRLVAKEPYLHKAMHEKFARFTTLLADAVVERGGAAFQ